MKRELKPPPEKTPMERMADLTRRVISVHKDDLPKRKKRKKRKHG